MATPKVDRSRDEAALGADTLGRFAQLDVLIVGMRGLGVEVAKNVVLSGPRSVSLLDHTHTRAADTGVNFYLTPAAIGHERAAACVEALQDLNSLVKIRAVEGELTEEEVKRHHVVVFTDAPRSQLLRWNAFCHSHGIVFLAADVRGVMGFAFSDFGPKHTVRDKDGVNPRSAVVTFVTKDAAAPSVNTDDSLEKRHGFSEGDYVVFREVQGMTQINNGRAYRVKDVKPYSFMIEGDTSGFSEYEGGGIVTQTKVPQEFSYLSLAEALENPRKDPTAFGGLLTPDLAKFGRSEQLHIAFHALEQFREAHGRLPGLRNTDDAAEVVRMANEFNASLKTREAGVSVDEVDAKLVALLASLSSVEFAPLNAFFGGVIGQEVMKVTGKFTPLDGWLYFDVAEVLPDGNAELPAAEYAPGDCRDDDAFGLFGRTFQSTLANKRTFLVGAGALGCELLKAFALAGVGTGPAGHVTVTDMDRIELSNLSRQFLYRRQHVGHAKSVTAAAASRMMNPSMNITAMEIPVGKSTENVFNDAFWSSMDFVVNALDNVEARKYVDERCIMYRKPLLESGTLGTQANTQVIIPFETEAYSDGQDPPEETIPMCTVREFPYFIEHCIEWARTLFAEEFADGLREAAAFIDAPEEFVEKETRELAVKPAPEKLARIVDVVDIARAPTLEKLVQHARIIFEENFFVKQRRQLQLPIDYVDPATGMKFWSGHKRPPIPAEFDLNNDAHREFVVHAAAILAEAFGVKLPDGWDAPAALAPLLATTKLPVFVPKEMVVKEVGGATVLVEKDDAADNSLKAEEDARAALEALKVALAELTPTGIRALRVAPVSFEKDDDSNHHVDFLTSATNMRASNYNIDQASPQQVRLIAGKIIPAIATTTCMVTGLIAVELYKVIAGMKAERCRSGFVNLAINTYTFSEPPGPVRTRSSKKHPVYDQPTKALPEGFTHWDRLEIHGQPDMTPHQFADWLKANHGVEMTQIFAKGATSASYDANWRAAKTKAERGGTSLRALFERALKTEIPEHKQFINFTVLAKDAEGTMVLLPTLYLFVR